MQSLLFKILLAIIAFGNFLTLSAQSTHEIENAVAAAKGAPRNQALNLEAGEMLKNSGQLQEAIPFLLKAGNTGNLNIAEIYFNLYEFDEADKYLDKYLTKRSKAEERRDKESSFSEVEESGDRALDLRKKIELGRSMLDRVEKIQIVDSINVPLSEFYKIYKLAKSAGSFIGDEEIEQLVGSTTLNEQNVTTIGSPGYVSESGDEIIWNGYDNTGNSTLYESSRLSNGKFDKPVALFDYATIFGNNQGGVVSYPFLASDGVTLYFAADGENSLGGLDIFISRRDGEGFLQPSNIGMPYNSPSNDYLYTIDEQRGLGWWATDRNMIDDSVTIYTFIPQDLRINYPVDTPDLSSYARISSIAATQDVSVDIDDIKKRYATGGERQKGNAQPLFELSLPTGRVIHSLSDFKNRMAASAMAEYLKEKANYNMLSDSLEQMRRRYAEGDRGLDRRILNAEQTLESKKKELQQRKNHIISLESNL